MKISRASIRNFRSLKNIDVSFDDYSVMVGPNGAGKSSVLYALEWFFAGHALEITDVHGLSETDSPNVELPIGERPQFPSITVTLTFSELTPMDRHRLAEYGRGKTASFSRSWTPGDSKSKTVGNALAGPGFASIRQLTRVTELRPAYQETRTRLEDLPDLGSAPTKDQIFQAMAEWETESAHASLLEVVAGSDATHMFGFNGGHVLRECVRMVLVPAAIDIAGEVGAAAKGSTLNALIGTLMADAGASARAAWLTENQARLDELNTSVRNSVDAATAVQAKRINERLAALVPNTTVLLNPTTPRWVPQGEPTVRTSVTLNGMTNDVARQGHGLQRAVMIAMFEALVPDADLTAANHELFADESSEESEARLALELAKLPALVIAIEEPEIYQHPVRARAFARVLSELAAQSHVQVVLATHSPYFVRPQQFESLRRFWLRTNESYITSTDIATVAAKANCDEPQVQKIVSKRLPNTFAEGFFSDVVVLVEGDTDKVVIETIAELLGSPLDALGISVLDMSGKEGLAIPFEMLTALEIATYVVADGDALGAGRKHSNDKERMAEAHASHRTSTDAICGWLPMANAVAVVGELPYSFEEPTVVADLFTVWRDDIEEELADWPSFGESLAAAGGSLRHKDQLAYRTALLESDVEEIPTSLRRCVEAIIAFASK